MIHGSPAIWLRFLSGPDVDRLDITNAEVIAAVEAVVMLDSLFPLEEIRVTSRRPESRGAFAARLRSVTGTTVRAVATADEAFEGADILVEASRLEEPTPLLRTARVRPGDFVVPYGTVIAVELDLLDVMDKVVVDDLHESRSGRFGADAGAMLRYR
jgi:ornithine cyclodeaminase